MQLDHRTKRHHHIQSFLSAHKPATATDKRLILSECRSKGYNEVYFGGSRKYPDKELPTICYHKFIQWLKARFFEIGDVVYDSTDKSIYIITDYIDGQSVSKSHVDSDGNYSDEPVLVSFCKTRRTATREQKLHFQRILSAQNLNWSALSCRLFPRYIPKATPYVSLWVLNEKVGDGIFKRIDADGNIVLHVFKDSKETIFCSGDYVLGPALDYTIRDARLAEKAQLVQDMSEACLRWHPRLKRIEPTNMRKKLDQGYFYQNSNWIIRSAIESGTDKDYRRYKKGNYFCDRKEADEYNQMAGLLRQLQLMGKINLEKLTTLFDE